MLSLRRFNKLTLAIIILNWNRFELLKTTFYSLLYNTDYPIQKIIIVDNNSSDGSVVWLNFIKKKYPKLVEVIFNNKNMGGEAINQAYQRVNADLIFISENDIEFLPRWYTPMINAFKSFPDLGQLSPFSPFPQTKLGEAWDKKPYLNISNYGKYKLYETVEMGNVTTTCMVRRHIVENIKWHNREDNTTGNVFNFPDDGRYSLDIKKLGYRVAWSGDYNVINWGHNIYTWLKDENYYRENYKAKTWFGINGVNQRLNRFGYKFVGGKLKKSV